MYYFPSRTTLEIDTVFPRTYFPKGAARCIRVRARPQPITAENNGVCVTSRNNCSTLSVSFAPYAFTPGKVSEGSCARLTLFQPQIRSLPSGGMEGWSMEKFRGGPATPPAPTKGDSPWPPFLLSRGNYLLTSHSGAIAYQTR